MGGKTRIDFRRFSGGRTARLISITCDNVIGSPVAVVTFALRTYSMVERLPFIEAGKWPGRRKLKGKLCSPGMS